MRSLEAPVGRRLWGLVLAGGDGVRLRALTQRISGLPIPKQYCGIVGRSLLERTLRRTRRTISPARTLVVVNRDHLPIASEQLRDVLPLNLVVQPENRDTGPGMILPLTLLERRDPDATVAVFPSDHWISSDGRFMRHVERAAAIVARRPDRIAVLGMGTFVEKPDATLAERLLCGGGLWSSFVMVFRVETMLAEIERLLPRELDVMRWLARRPEERRRAYRTMRPWNFNLDVLGRIVRSVVVVPVGDVAWADWGTPQAIVQSLAEREEKPFWWADATALVA